MKFSNKWLREWVNPELSADELAEQITMAGLEVDGVEPVAGEFSKVLVGEVVECGQHPDADKLRVTQVNVGEDELLDIVCGAPNCRQGLKVAVAVVGARLPGDFKIKKTKLRGQPSHGMLCSASELALSDESDGIMELPLDAPVGQDLREYLKLDDVTIEVDLTPNRADCLGIKGLAREVGVLNELEVNELTVSAKTPDIDDAKNIILDAPAACPRYLGRVVKNVNVKAQSPLWLTEKLRRCGVRSIDPVVDITNYVLLELGHPMHAFDLSSLEGDIHVRMAKDNEKLVLLDGNEVEVADNTLLIADDVKALAMAGIFGGLKSGVTADSKDIFLESAFFSPGAIRGRARQYGLHTDASHRYERGVDPELQRIAMERATQLILEICGGEAGPITEAVSQRHVPQAKDIVLTQARLARLLGVDIDATTVTGILERLGFTVSFESDAWQVNVPSYRFDIAIEEDLIEEVARVYGYNKIADVAPIARLVMGKHKESNISLNQLKSRLVTLGYQEAITYSFVDPKTQALMFPEQDTLALPHPISVEMSSMRVSLLPGLIDAVVYNQNRQQTRVRLFETGLKFIPDQDAENGVKQTPMLAGVVSGLVHSEHWSIEKVAADFYHVKGDIESLLQSTSANEEFSFSASTHPSMHPGQTAAVSRNGCEIGHIGIIHPRLIKKLGLNSKVVMFELETAALQERNVPEAVPVSKYPANRRDIAVIVDESVVLADIVNSIEKVGGNQLVDLNLFDVYQGEGIGDNKKSLAFSLTLQDTAKTLEESDINSVVNRIVSELTTNFDASLRD